MLSFRKIVKKVGRKSDGTTPDIHRSSSLPAAQIQTTTLPISGPAPVQASSEELASSALPLDSSNTSHPAFSIVRQPSVPDASVLQSQHPVTQSEPEKRNISAPNNAGQNKAFEAAFHRLSENLDASERSAFLQAYVNITPEQTLETIKRLDDTDASKVVRRGTRALGPAIRVLEQFMAGVAIGIQQSPEISSLVVGGVRLLISLITKFIDFYNKLSEMICFIGDYLAPLEGFSRNTSDDSIVQDALVGIYSDLITFIREARQVFVNRDNSMKKLGTFRTFLRVQWQPFDDRFGEIKSKFVHHLSVLQTSVQAQQLNLLNEQVETLNTGFTNADLERQRIRSNELSEERRKFLGWISKINHEADFDRIIKQRHPDTGNWFLEHDNFGNWKEGPDSGLLWCHGNPGAGKSILASVALDHLTKYELDDEKTCLIFAYYTYRHRERDDPSSLVASFIKQICSKLNHLPDRVRKFFQLNFYNDRTPTYEDMNHVLLELLAAYDKVFVVIDALDECQALTQDNHMPGYGRRLRYRQEVLDFIDNLVSNTTFPVKVLVTSRREDDIRDAFERRPVIEIDANQVNADIKTYLHDELELRVKKKVLKLDDPKIRDHIFSTLASRAQGMFLWVTLQLDWICEQRGDDDILAELERLPQNLCETYDRILERLNQQPPRLRELTRKALMWVLYARRPLSMKELIEAIAIEPSMKSHQSLKSKLCEGHVVISCTGALLAPILSDDDIVRPIHTSVHEYLTSSNRNLINPSVVDFFIDEELADAELAKACMIYLQRDIFNKNKYWVTAKVDAVLTDYSVKFFDKHILCLKGSPQDIYDQIEMLLNSTEEKLAFMVGYRYDLPLKMLRSAVNATTLIYATDLYYVLQCFRPDSRWLKLAPRRNSLHLAAANGSVAAMQALVDLGQEIDELNEENKSPLHYSAEYGHFESTKWLIDHDACVDLLAENFGTALQGASWGGYLAIVELLLKHNADVNLQGGNYGTALQAASRGGHLAVVELLLKHNADFNLQGGYYGTALQAASRGGHLAVIELLLKHNADVNLQGGYYGTALQAASLGGYLAVVELLLKHNADVNLQGGNCGTALQAASLGGHLTVIELLLKHNADVNLQGGNYGTALQAASRGGHLAVVELLLKHNADVNLQGGNCGTALQAASLGGHLTVVELLLKHNADVNLQGEYYGTALQAASLGGYLPVVELLLAHGAKITSRSLENACADSCDEDAVASVLLRNGAQVTTVALDSASRHGWKNRYQMLIEYQRRQGGDAGQTTPDSRIVEIV